MNFKKISELKMVMSYRSAHSVNKKVQLWDIREFWFKRTHLGSKVIFMAQNVSLALYNIVVVDQKTKGQH